MLVQRHHDASMTRLLCADATGNPLATSVGTFHSLLSSTAPRRSQRRDLQTSQRHAFSAHSLCSARAHLLLNNPSVRRHRLSKVAHSTPAVRPLLLRHYVSYFVTNDRAHGCRIRQRRLRLTPSLSARALLPQVISAAQHVTLMCLVQPIPPSYVSKEALPSSSQHLPVPDETWSP